MYRQIARNKRLAIFYTAIFFVVWVGAGSVIGLLTAVLASRPGGASPLGADAMTGAAIAAVAAVAGIVLSRLAGAALVLSVSGARAAPADEFPQLHHLVEALAIGDGLPKPAVYVIDDPSPNAFATGYGPNRAAITVTTGLLVTMDREELEGVLSHEMSHIKNFDIRLLLVVSTLIGLAGLLASLIWRSAFFLRVRRGNTGGALLAVLVAGVVLGAVAVVLGPIIRLALSRRREELADVSGVELTRNPMGLLRALQELQRNEQPFARFNHATAAMCIDDPLQHHRNWLHHLFDTHPPIAERIAILEGLLEGTYR